MAANDTSKAVWRRAALFVGAAGEVAATPIGYMGRSNGLKTTVDKSVEDYKVDDLDGVAIKKTVDRGFKVEGDAIQLESGVVKYLLGLDPSGEVFTIGGPSCEDISFSVKIVGSRRDGIGFTIAAPNCYSVKALELMFSTEKLTEMPFEFAAVDGAAGLATITIGNSPSATLSSGVLTRPAGGYVQVAGQGGVADVLDSITAADLADGEKLLLQIYATTAPITLTHLADTLELTGAADWTMTKLEDFILLQYNATGTKWVEISRFDAIA